VLTSHRSPISSLASASGAFALLAWSAVAVAQPSNVECRSTETQAECHARLGCKPDEELEACQKRLLKCKANEGLDECKKRAGKRGDRDDGGGGDDGDRGRDRDDRGGDRGDSDRGDRWRDRDDGGDSGRGDRWDRDGDDGGGDSGDSDGGDRWRDRDDGGRSGRRRGEGRGGRSGDGGGFQANKTFGLGLELGEPTGFTGKYFVSDTGALDFGVGWIYRHYYYDDGLHLYFDYLWHPTSFASTPSVEVPFYIGLGLRYWDFEYCDPAFCYDCSAFGLRIPIGIAFDFNTAPFDIFLQVVPVFDIISDDYYDRYDDRTHAGIDGSIGFRFWFN